MSLYFSADKIILTSDEETIFPPNSLSLVHTSLDKKSLSSFFPFISNIDSSIYDRINYTVTPNNFLIDSIQKDLNLTQEHAENISHITLNKIPLLYTFTSNASFSYKIEDVQQQISSARLLNSFSSSTNILPYFVRYVDQQNNIYIETPPFKINVDFKLGSASDKAKKIEPLEIWVPWCLTKLQLSGNNSVLNRASIYFSDTPLSFDEDARYIPCYLPNTYTDGSICFSNSLSTMPIESYQGIRYLYSLILNEYMSGGWNLDLELSIRFYSYSLANNDVDNTIFKEYCYPNKYSLKKRFPEFSDSKIQSLLKPSSNPLHRANYSKYFFYMLSSFTLEETLSFVKSLKSSSYHNCTTFSKMIGKSEDNNISNHSYFNNEDIRSSFNQSYQYGNMINEHLQKLESKVTYVLAFNYIDDSCDPIDLHDLYYSYLSNNVSYYHHSHKDSDGRFRLFGMTKKMSQSIFENLSRIYSNPNNDLIYYDFSTGKIEYQTMPPGMTIQELYSQIVLQTACSFNTLKEASHVDH